MAIEKISIQNFKGIFKETQFELKPITLFIGPNSSGKSSSLHALAALAQTIKLSNSRLSVVLDDEFAQVHLGRFIEVIHSKSYSDTIDIGLAFKARRDITISDKTFIKKNQTIEARFSFKSTKRTQDVYIEKADFIAPDIQLAYKWLSSGNYSVKIDGKVSHCKATSAGGLKFTLLPPGSATKGKEATDFLYAFIANEAISDQLAQELRGTLYLGPFRQSPLRRYPTRGSAPAEVGSQGESAVTLLANEFVQTKTRPHAKQISTWMRALGLAKGVDVTRVGNSDLFGVSVTLNDDVKLPVADLGYGVSQVLPVLAQCSFAQKGATLIFEQPELHLHPGAAKNLAKILAQAAKEKGLTILAETHSRELFQQLLTEIRDGRLSANDIAAYEVRREERCSKFKRIELVDEDGNIDIYDPWDRGLE